MSKFKLSSTTLAGKSPLKAADLREGLDHVLLQVGIVGPVVLQSLQNFLI